MTVPLDIQSVLPPTLAEEALDVAALQDALHRLEGYQHQARTALFRKLAYHALQGPDVSFEDALLELSQSGSSLAADTPEATLVQYVQLYRGIVEQEQQVVTARATEMADRDIQAQLQEFRLLMQQGQLSEASWCLVRLQRTVREHDASQASRSSTDGRLASMPQALLAAQLAAAQQHVQQCGQCDTQLAQAIEAGIQHSAEVVSSSGQQGTGQLHLRGAVLLSVPGHQQGVVVASKEVWAAVQAQGALAQRASALAELLLSQVFGPILRAGAAWECHTQPSDLPGVDSSQPHGQQVVVSWQPAAAPVHQGRAEAARQVLQAVASTLLQLEEGLVRALGDALWDRLASLYVAGYVQPAAEVAASRPDRSAVLQALLQEAADLESWAANMGFTDGATLKSSVGAAMAQLEAQQQVAPLQAARAALLQDLQGRADTVVVGELLAVDHALYQRLQSSQASDWEAADPGCGVAQGAPLTAGGCCRVGQGAAQLVSLIHQLLDQAASAGSQASAAALVHGVHKLALLARSLAHATPATRQQLQSVLPLALLHHNNLVHLADTLLLCCPVYGPRLEPLLGEPLGLIEPALLLKQEAEAVLQQQVRSQVAMFEELLVGGYQAFRRLGRSASAQEGITYRKTTSQVLHSLGRLGKVLADHCTPQRHLGVASQVLGAVCDHINQQLLAKSDIGVDDCRELKEILSPLAQQAQAALIPAASLNAPAAQQPTPSGATQQQQARPHQLGVPPDLARACLRAATPALRCLVLLLELLDVGLRDLLAAWEQGRMQECGLSADQVVHLACALFEQSEHRRDVIARIRASSW